MFSIGTTELILIVIMVAVVVVVAGVLMANMKRPRK
jgi:hypothetical protein